MKKSNIILIISIISFYYLINQFLDLGGLNHRLLKILLELIVVLFVMIMVKYQDQMKEITDWDSNQKKIVDFFKRNGK